MFYYLNLDINAWFYVVGDDSSKEMKRKEKEKGKQEQETNTEQCAAT